MYEKENGAKRLKTEQELDNYGSCEFAVATCTAETSCCAETVEMSQKFKSMSIENITSDRFND